MTECSFLGDMVIGLIISRIFTCLRKNSNFLTTGGKSIWMLAYIKYTITCISYCTSTELNETQNEPGNSFNPCTYNLTLWKKYFHQYSSSCLFYNCLVYLFLSINYISKHVNCATVTWPDDPLHWINLNFHACT